MATQTRTRMTTGIVLLLLVLGLIFAPVEAKAATADGYEPDDTYATAGQIVPDGGPQQHTIHVSGDEDWMWLAVTSGDTYMIETHEGSPAEGMDTVLYLYASDGETELGYNDDGGDETFSKITYTADADGTVYIVVTGWGSETGSYAIGVTTAGRITGTVTNGAAGVQDVGVRAYVQHPEYGWMEGTLGTTGADGSYSIEGLPPGVYRISFEPGYPYFGEYWNDKPDLDSADDIVITAGETRSSVDAVLGGYGTITGTVTDGSNPISSVWVDCYGYDPDSGWTIETADSTGADGTYSLFGLVPGIQYRLEFRHSGGEYLVEWYDDADAFADATTVQVTSGGTTSGIDAVLAPAGRIVGTVFAGSSPVGNVLVQAYHYDAVWGYGVWAAGMWTGDDGVYVLGCLPSGTYRIRFDDGSGPYPVEWWDNVATIDAASDIAVAAGYTITDIDAVLGGLPVNAAPAATGDAYSTQASTVLHVGAPGVLANDTDADGDELTAVKKSDPAHGIVTLSADGSFTYTPAADFTGTDTFTYAANDGAVDSNTVTVTITVTPQATIEDNAAGVTFDRFVPSAGAAYSGGTYIYGRWTGTRIESRFTGTKIAWYGPKQPVYGKADVYIDGVYKATVDCYAPSGSATVSTKLWESATLGAGTHTLSIRLTGAKNGSSGGYIVVVDKLVVSGTGAGNPQTRANESAGTFSGAWITCPSTTYTDGTYRYSRWAGAKIRYTFTGTKVAWIGPRCWNYGRADVYIDGVKKATVSQYGVLGWRYRVWESATLAAGQHTIEIRVLGTKEAASTNTIIVVDGFDVKP